MERAESVSTKGGGSGCLAGQSRPLARFCWEGSRRRLNNFPGLDEANAEWRETERERASAFSCSCLALASSDRSPISWCLRFVPDCKGMNIGHRDRERQVQLLRRYVPKWR